jgi:hypothetical protein
MNDIPQKPADWNPALVWPQPEQDMTPQAEEFEVIGETAVDGHPPGSRFKAVLDANRKRLLLGSHLELVAGATLEELQEQAKGLDIKGRSKMDKAQLQEAVEHALAGQVDPSDQPNPAAVDLPEDQQ